MPTAEDLYYDAVFGEDDLNPDLVVSDYLPKLLRSNSGGLPMYKYLRDTKVEQLDERVLKQLEKRRTVDSYLNDAIRDSARGWRAQLSDYSVRDLVMQFGFDVAHTRLAALEASEIDVNQLGAHLEQVIVRNGGRAFIKSNPELKRAIRIYDFLRYKTEG